jgi:hypothetical protein
MKVNVAAIAVHILVRDNACRLSPINVFRFAPASCLDLLGCHPNAGSRRAAARAGLAGTGMHDVKNRKMSKNGAATELFQLINRDPQQKKTTKSFLLPCDA